MADESTKGPFCRGCGRELEEARYIPLAERSPCPLCGSIAHEYRLSLGATIKPEGALATASAPAPRTVIENYTATYERRVRWSYSPDGVPIVEVHDEDGNLIDLGVQFEAEDALLVVIESLLPPD